jgi:3-oxoacyl-ACP reductase-like protein
MAKRRQTKREVRRAAPAAGAAPTTANPAPDDQISYSALPLHDLFEQQTRAMLDRSDLDEEQKQNILVAMSCPCCGAGAMSYTVKLKR